jgi:hypothetical protein
MNKTQIQGKFLLTAALTAVLAFAGLGASAATLDVTKFGADPTGARTSQEVVLKRKFLPPKGTKDARRPYEMVWANRRADEVPPVDRLESAAGWIAAGENAVASVTNADDRLLFGDGTLRLDYRAAGDSPKVRLRRETPLKLAAFDTFGVWIYGNNFYGRSPAGTPSTRLSADFTDADGQLFSFDVATILHREWCKFQVKVPAHLRARTMKGGCTFDGFTLTGGTNKESRRLDFTSVCAFVEELKPLSFKPRAKRGVQVFKDEPQGINTGDGRLPFPTVETTVVPPASAVDAALEFRTPAKPGVWDDLAFRVGKKGPWIPLAIGGGVWPRSAADKAKVRWQRIGNSLVADVVVEGGDVEELRFGGLGVEPDAKALPIPFYSYGSEIWDERPQVVVVEGEAGTRFVSATLDWTQSNASLPFPPESGSELVQANGGARYRPKTDGSRNDVYERFVWTVSPKFEETLPFIPNPASPWRAVTGRAAWTAAGASGDRTPNYEDFFWKRRAGLRRLTVTDHETMWRDGDESFTFRTDPAPGRGGDQGQYDYARKMIDGFGFRYGPYNNYTDYAPVNGYWHSDFVSRLEDGNWQSAWARCTGPKPLYAVEMCEKLAPVIQRKFNFNTAYCDVHTAVSPWSRTDYDARVPGAGTFAQTFYAYGEIMLIQKHTWGGPVASEGGHQWLYSGLTDQNYGQDRTYQLMKHPWIVDFDLLRMHPLTSDFGCYSEMLFGDANVPQGKDAHWRVVEPWTAVTLAFGHSAFLLPEDPIYSYYMTLAPASRYSQENVKTIRYVDAKGRLLTTSKAVANGEIAHNRVVVAYDGGTLVVVNGDPEGGWLSVRRGEGRLALPPWGFFCRGGETVAYSGWAKDGTNRVDFCRGGREDGYVFLHGRGVTTEFPGGATDGWLARLAEAGGTEEIIPELKEGSDEIGLPYAATRLVGLRAHSNAEVVKEIPFRIDEKGWTRFKRDPVCYSYRATLPKGWAEPSADVYESWCLRPNDFKAPAVAARRVVEPQMLPKRFRRGVLLPDGSETELEASSGGVAQLGGTTCGGKSQQGLLVHPPYQDGAKGAVFACYAFTPNTKSCRFVAEVGKADGSVPGDGILFKVAVRVGTDPIRVLAEKRVTEHRWEPIEADLSPFVGQRIRLYLIADPGGNTYGDGGAWANMRLLASDADSASDVALAPDGEADMTKRVRAAVWQVAANGGGTVCLADGVYHFYSSSAEPVALHISNHDQPATHPVFLPFVGVTNVSVVAANAKFVMHGMGTAILLQKTKNVSFKGVTVEWERPFFAQATIVGFENGRTRVRFLPRDRVEIADGRLSLVGEDWRNELLHGIVFDGRTHEIVERTADEFVGERNERCANGDFLLDVDLSKKGAGAKVGDVYVMRSWYRPHPVVCLDRATDTTFENFVYRDGFGMGILAQLSENFTLRGGGCYPRSREEFSSNTADATHFSNCRGVVTVENCRFEGMMDDALNVHSTCLGIVGKSAPDQVRCRYMHPQAIGLGVFAPGDVARFIAGKTLENGAEMRVKAVETHDPREITLTLRTDGEGSPRTPPMDGLGFAVGDAVENASWQCAVVFRNNVVANNRARGVLFTTPKKIVCEGNFFDHVSGAAILLAGDAQGWYESGACEDVVIRKNRFRDCLTSRFQYCDALVSIHPEVKDLAAQKRRYHHNVVIEDNEIETSDAPLLFALSAENVVWRRNRVTRHDRYQGWGKPAFQTQGCENISLP